MKVFAVMLVMLFVITALGGSSKTNSLTGLRDL